MLIRVRRASDLAANEITDEEFFLRRRQFLRGAAAAAGALAGASLLGCMSAEKSNASDGGPDLPKLGGVVKGPYATDEKQTSYKDATRYNNFYEFGYDKEDPAANAHRLVTRPWSVTVEGEVERAGVIDFDELIKPHRLEERIYRLRCVEAWSMVIPWVGFPLGDLLRRFGPTSKAKFVAFQTLYNPEQMPEQRVRSLDWPYQEGLRIDEAMHPLTILAVGMYGRILPNQNGAPLRLVVPWKYGFKSIKSIVKIRLVETQPPTTWSAQAPHEYGFYANVNPNVDHPRWSQASERRIGEFRRRPTLMFNGYAEEVASLYTGMDLSVHF